MKIVKRKTASRFLQRTAFSMAALAVCIALMACQQTNAEAPPSSYTATPDERLLTYNPTLPTTDGPIAVTITPAPTPAPTLAPTLASTLAPTLAPTYTSSPDPTYTPQPAIGTATTEDRPPAHPFSAQTLDGQQFSLEETYGSPTLIAFWAAW